MGVFWGAVWIQAPTKHYLQVSVHHEAIVHVLQAQDDFSSIKPHLLFRKHSVLGEVVVQISSWNENWDGIKWTVNSYPAGRQGDTGGEELSFGRFLLPGDHTAPPSAKLCGGKTAEKVHTEIWSVWNSTLKCIYFINICVQWLIQQRIST